MKQIILGLVFLLGVSTLVSQNLTLPQASPRASVMQEIGLARVSIEYGSPSVNNREVWGKLVPYGMSPGQGFNDGNAFPWRAGANVNTIFTTTHEIMIEGKTLPAGSYGLHMLPGESEWQIMFSKNSTSWGSFFYKESEDVLRIKVKPTWKNESRERLTYGFDDITPNSAVAFLRWEKIRIPMKITIDEGKQVMASVRDELRTILAFNPQALIQGANQAMKYKIGLEDALVWVERAQALGGGTAAQFAKVDVLEAMGKGKEAGDLKKTALENGTEVDLNNYGYQLLGRKAINPALEVFELNVKRFPKSWNVYDSLGEAQAANGDTKKAIDNYKKALKMAPDAQKDRINQILTGLEKS